MAIIAILVLLAAPRFLGRTEDAVANRIKNDIRVAETKLDEYLIRHENLDDWESSVPTSDLEDHQSNGALYDREGLMDGEDFINEGNYSVVPSDFVEREVTSQLDGDFYANEEGHVYYSPILGDGHGADDEDLTGSFEIPDYYVQATDDDFLKVEDDKAPNGEFYFAYAGDDDYVVIPEVIKGVTITDTFLMFAGFEGWHEEFDMSWWFSGRVSGVALDNPNITNTARMFESLNQGLDEDEQEANDYHLDLTYFNTTGVTDMSYMFGWAPYIDEIIFGEHFDTSSVTTMESMFDRLEGTAGSSSKVDLTQFDTSNVTNMASMFNSSEISGLDVSSFDTSNVTTMNDMFSQTKYWSEPENGLDLTSFDTSNVTDMSWMFNRAPLAEIDLSSFNMSNVTTHRNMFSGTGLGAGKGYARTQEDADILNNIFDSSVSKFIVK